MSRYDEFVSGKHIITMGGIDNDLYAEPDDYATFIKESAQLKDTKDFSPIIDLTVKLVKKGTDAKEVAEENFEEGLTRYLWRNAPALVDELTIAFGLSTRKELEDFKKRELEKLRKKG